MRKKGYNLQICGFDAYHVKNATPKTLLKCYEDISRPFGHELVLFTMLCIKNEEDYPWRIYKTLDF